MPPIPLVIETDIHGDVDDVGALALAHVFADRGLARLLAVGVNTPSTWGALAVQAVNEYYGRPDTQIGVLYPPDDSVAGRDYACGLAQRFAPRLPDRLPPAVDMLHETLSTIQPGTATLVSIGFHHNLVALLDRDGGRELVERAVGQTVVMAGVFPRGAEYNMTEHPAEARRFVDEWPRPIDFVGYEIGEHVITGRDLSWPTPAVNPVAVAYELYTRPGEGRPSWDLIAIDYAVRGGDGSYEPSEPGRVDVDERGHVAWAPEPGGPHRYVRPLVDDEQLAARLDALLAAVPRVRAR